MEQLVRIIPKNSSEEVRVELTNYRGYDLVGMRVYSDFTKSKEMLPTNVAGRTSGRPGHPLQ
jgi:hypothetical protein